MNLYLNDPNLFYCPDCEDIHNWMQEDCLKSLIKEDKNSSNIYYSSIDMPIG